MIKYDYDLRRDEKDEIITYKPDLISKELPNLVYIEGPNSSGKSTLLHILALSFYGTKNLKIKQALQEKMDNLVNSEHQHISFKIAITNKNNKVELTAEKRDFKTKDIIIKDEHDERMSAETFAKKYNLIYDIPEDPTKRLSELTHEIKDIQYWFEKKIGFLRTRFVEVIHAVKSAKDPKRIIEVKRDKDAAEHDIIKINAAINEYNEMLKSTQFYKALKFYMKYKEDRDKIKDTVKGIEKGLKENKKIKIQVDKEYLEIKNKLTDAKEEIKTLYYKVTPTLQHYFGKDKKEKDRFLLWKDLNIEEEFLNPDTKQVLKMEGSHFRRLLDDILEEESKKGDASKAQVLKELIIVLENYVKLNIVIPGTELSISKFTEILKEEAKQYDTIVANIENIKCASNMLSDIIEKRKLVVDVIIPNLKKVLKKSETADKVDDNTEEYRDQQIHKRCLEFEKMMNYYKQECLKLGMDEQEIPLMYSSIVLGHAVKNLDSLSEDALKDRIFNLEAKIKTETDNLYKTKAKLKFVSQELEQLEQKKPHIYHSHLKCLESTLSQIQLMEQNIKNYDGYIMQLINKKIDKENFSKGADVKEKNKYFNHIFNYLGKRVGVIRHIDKEYNVIKIDLLNNEIITKGGKNIKLADMGTGQTQSAFLKGLLNANDGRTIIALFDEVAMMDEKSMKPIHDKFKQLYEAEKLLVGIIVQKAEKVKVASII